MGLTFVPRDISIQVENLNLEYNRIIRIKNLSFIQFIQLHALKLSGNDLTYIENGSFDYNASSVQFCSYLTVTLFILVSLLLYIYIYIYMKNDIDATPGNIGQYNVRHIRKYKKYAISGNICMSEEQYMRHIRRHIVLYAT